MLLCAAATLVTRNSCHPAIMDLLLDAASQIHGKGNWIEEPGLFPSPNYVDFPLAGTAVDFYESGRPWLMRVMPFWIASLLTRLKIMLVPLATLLLPLVKMLLPLYHWRIESRITKWYDALQDLEDAQERVQ